MDGTWDANKTIEIGGMEFTSSEMNELVNLAKELGISLDGLDIGDTGLEEESQKAKALKEAIDSISTTEVRVAIQSEGFETSDQVNNIMTAIEQIDGKQAKVDFIADASQYFMENDSVESAINAMPDEIKLKYNIGVEGNDKLKEIQSRVKELPKDIRTMIYAQTYGVENVEMLEKIVDAFGGKTATAILQLDGIDEALRNASTFKEQLQIIGEYICKPGVEIEGKDEVLNTIDKILEELNKTDEQESNPEINVKGDTSN